MFKSVRAVLLVALLLSGCASHDPERETVAGQLTAPPEWTDQVRTEMRTGFLCLGSGCTAFRVEWSAETPPSAEDLLSVAGTAGWNRTEIDEPCPPPAPDDEPGPYCTLTATVDGVDLTLWSSYEPRKSPPWRITLLAE